MEDFPEAKSGPPYLRFIASHPGDEFRAPGEAVLLGFDRQKQAWRMDLSRSDASGQHSLEPGSGWAHELRARGRVGQIEMCFESSTFPTRACKLEASLPGRAAEVLDGTAVWYALLLVNLLTPCIGDFSNMVFILSMKSLVDFLSIGAPEDMTLAPLFEHIDNVVHGRLEDLEISEMAAPRTCVLLVLIDNRLAGISNGQPWLKSQRSLRQSTTNNWNFLLAALTHQF